MKSITITAPWSYVTPTTTIDYPAGTHRVDDAIADAAQAAGVTGTKGKTNGDESAAKAGSAGDTGTDEG